MKIICQPFPMVILMV